MKLKSLFISPYVIMVCVLSAFAVTQYFMDRGSLGWFVAMVSALASLSYFAYLYLRYPAEVQFGLIVVTTVSLATTVISFADFYANNTGVLTPFYVCLALAIGWLLYDRWYSRMPQPKAFYALVGSELPNLSLVNEKEVEKQVTLEKGQYHILIFHRGNWCPFCVAQKRDAINQVESLNSANTMIHIIGPKHVDSIETLQRIGSTNLRFWADPKGRMSETLYIGDRNSVPLGFGILGFDNDTTLPAVVVLDDEGKVIYTRVAQDYRKRNLLNFYLNIVLGHQNGEFDPLKELKTQ